MTFLAATTPQKIRETEKSPLAAFESDGQKPPFPDFVAGVQVSLQFLV
jgi:hypothetical protein